MTGVIDVSLNFIACVVTILAVICVCSRYLELKGFKYSVVKTPTGLAFEYKLGVYGGRIDLIRDETVVAEPQLSQGVRGWECKFPTSFTLKEMCLFMSSAAVSLRRKGSHSKDLLIFNEVINLKNDALISMNGNIYTYDNSQHKPFL